MKKVLIFGASGQIGRHLIRKLTKNNYIVTAVTRNLHQKAYVLKTQANAGYIEIVEANIFDEQKIRNLIKSQELLKLKLVLQSTETIQKTLLMKLKVGFSQILTKFIRCLILLPKVRFYL